MSTDTAETPTDTIAILDENHQGAFWRAMTNILSTSSAENTYAQILDGLPTMQSLDEGYAFIEGHPVYELNHAEICEGFLDKAREFRTEFDLSHLHFRQSTLYAFQNTIQGSDDFNLRLIELVVVACHQIAVFLYEMDDGAHKHELFDNWLKQKLAESILRSKPGRSESGDTLPVAPFVHRAYMFPERYPNGIADVVGYWAEGQIFGGTVVFDRGETEQECKAMWIHGARSPGPRTLYPPTTEQFNSLVNFLLSIPGSECPLPIQGTADNRPRWDPWHALAQYHIFRDKYERKVSPDPPRNQCQIKSVDWPEVADEQLILHQDHMRSNGLVVTEDDLSTARKRLREVTPSSPLYRRWSPDASATLGVLW